MPVQAATKPALNPARHAQFDRASQRCRAMLVKIQVARKDLRMEEDDYRQIVFDKTGRTSLKEASPAELDAVLAVMAALGWRAVPKSGARPGAARPAQHPMARKARALWISLYHLGVVHNPGEAALEAFAKRQLGCEKLVWARQSDAGRLIEALKDMARRGGWIQHNRATNGILSVIQLQEGLCHAIVDKLRSAGAVPDNWPLNTVAERLCGFEPPAQAWTSETYTAVAAQLGQKLRELAPQMCGVQS